MPTLNIVGKREAWSTGAVKTVHPAVMTALELLESDSCIMEGVCLRCGQTQDAVEPDAVKYTCHNCERPTVYGAHEIIMRFA